MFKKKNLINVIRIVIIIALYFMIFVSICFASNDAEDYSAEKSGLENSWRYSNGELVVDETTQNAGIFKSRSIASNITSSKAIAHGIDVSVHNGKIDWEKVKNSGIDFAIIRCGYGGDYIDQDDAYWEYNVSECERLGIPYGVYLYSYADSVARASSEADHVIRLLKGHNPTYPVYYDLEESSLASVSNRVLLGQMAKTFCDKVEKQGYRVGIYANLNWWNNYLTDTVFENNGWDKWVAQYYSYCTYEKDFHIWQYTSKGNVDGISTYVDLNYEFAERPQPRIESMKNGNLTISWQAVEGATQYSVSQIIDDNIEVYTDNCKDNRYLISNLKNGNTYKFLVQAKVDGQWTFYTENDILECYYIDSPNVMIPKTGDGSVTLEWEPVENASKYAIAEYVNGKYVTCTYDCTDTKYTVSDLANGYTHSFLVQANVNGRWSTASTDLLVRAMPTGTIKPTVTVDAKNGEALLNWDKVPGATKYAVAVKTPSGYKTYTYDCKGTNYTITGLSIGKTYQFLVQANINGKWSEFTNNDLVNGKVIDTTIPDVKVSKTGDGSVTLEWDPVENASKYAIAEYVNGKYVTYTYDCTDTKYTVSDLANGYTHSFLVQANVNGRWSTASTDLLVRAMPTGTIKPTVTVDVKNGEVLLNWNKVPGATKYAVAVKTPSGYKTYTYDCKGTNYTITGLSIGKTYQFLVQANINGKWSEFTNNDLINGKVIDTTIPDVKVSKTGDGSVTLEWDPVENASKYAIAEYVNGKYVTCTYDCTDTKYTVSDLANGYTHSFLVQANVNGRWSTASTDLLVRAMPTGTIKPTVTVDAKNGEALLNWDKVPGATKYAVAVKTPSGYKTYTYDCKGTNYTITGLSIGKTYQFLVQANINGKWSEFTNNDLVNGKVIDTTIPDVKVSKTGDGSVTLEWDPVENASKYAIAEYVNGKYVTYTYDCTDTKYTVSDLANGYTHSFLVQANVNGRWSTVSTDLLVKVVL